MSEWRSLDDLPDITVPGWRSVLMLLLEGPKPTAEDKVLYSDRLAMRIAVELHLRAKKEGLGSIRVWGMGQALKCVPKLETLVTEYLVKLTKGEKLQQ